MDLGLQQFPMNVTVLCSWWLHMYILLRSSGSENLVYDHDVLTLEFHSPKVEQYIFQPCLLLNSWDPNHCIPRMCYLSMLSTLLPPINSNQQERMWAGQEIQFSLYSTCLPFIQNELRSTLGRTQHGSEMQQLGGFLDVAEQQFLKTLQDRHVDTWHMTQCLWGRGWPLWC